MIPKGLIVSIQGYSRETTEELTEQAASGGACALRTDKLINCRLPIIGLKKSRVSNPETDPYITATLEDVKAVAAWSKIIAVDFRRANKERKQISDYSKEMGLCIVADIMEIEDYFDILENEYYHQFVTPALRVFKKSHYPDFEFYENLIEYDCKNMIAEGNIQTREQVKRCYEMGINNVCIGAAISDVYKLTKKYSSVRIERGKDGK